VSLFQQASFLSGSINGWGAWGYDTLEGGSINAGQEALVNNRLVIPVTGIYQGGDWIKWLDNAGAGAGNRGHMLWVNDQVPGSAEADYTFHEETTRPVATGGLPNPCTTVVKINRVLKKGDVVVAAAWQNSGITLTTTHRIQLALVRVVG
jgi:hypothetical protein